MAQPTYYALFLWKRVAAGRVIAGTKSRTRQRWRLAWRNKSLLSAFSLLGLRPSSGPLARASSGLAATFFREEGISGRRTPQQGAPLSLIPYPLSLKIFLSFIT